MISSAWSRPALAVLFLLGVQQSLRAEVTTAREPLVILIQHNPWLSVLGSDSPQFALYSDGLVVYATDNGEFASASLSVAERDDLLRRLELPSVEGLPTDYVLTKVTDRPTTELFTWQGGHRKRLTIYGLPSHFSSELPVPLSRIYVTLVQYRHPRARPWLPTLEIMLSPRAQPGATVPWPAGWPTLRSPGTRARGNSYSLFIDGARLRELKALLASLRSQQAGVMLDDKSWSVAARLPFPSEEQWMRVSW